MKATAKGVVHVEHESWSAVAEEDIARGEPVIVTAVDPDNVTLTVRKHRPCRSCLWRRRRRRRGFVGLRRLRTARRGDRALELTVAGPGRAASGAFRND